MRKETASQERKKAGDDFGMEGKPVVKKMDYRFLQPKLRCSANLLTMLFGLVKWFIVNILFLSIHISDTPHRM